MVPSLSFLIQYGWYSQPTYLENYDHIMFCIIIQTIDLNFEHSI
jgi:hypothetical protein